MGSVRRTDSNDIETTRIALTGQFADNQLVD